MSLRDVSVKGFLDDSKSDPTEASAEFPVHTLVMETIRSARPR